MRLAYLVSQYPATSHTFIRREVAALRRRGLDVQTFSVRPPASADLSDDNRAEAASTFVILGQPASAFVAAHLRALVAAPARYVSTFGLALSHRPPGLQGFLLSLAHFTESILLARTLQACGVTQLHTHFANSAATVGLLASRYARIGWSFVMHGPSETDYPAGYLLADKVRAANMVIAVSWFGKSQAMRLVAPDHWGKFRLVHCGIELDRLPSRQSSRTERSIICVGRLCSDKAQAGLLMAFASVGDSFTDVRLRIVGDGPDRTVLESMAEELGLRDRVDFLGRLSETETLQEIARSEIMVLPSFWEGLPVVLMESMAIGVPVITSRVAGVPEMIEDGKNGLLFAPARWAELGDCMRNLLTSLELGSRLAIAAQRTILEKFNIDASAERLERYFESLAAGISSPPDRPSL